MDAISPVAATNQVTQWLSAFGAALERRDVSAAAKMFAEECYWRDLVSFTWNITTCEGRDGVAAMLAATLDRREAFALARSRARRPRPTASPRPGSPSRPRSARGFGHVRLKGEECWTLLTTMTELKGHEEQTRPAPAEGRRARRHPEPAQPGSKQRSREAGGTRLHHASPTA